MKKSFNFKYDYNKINKKNVKEQEKKSFIFLCVVFVIVLSVVVIYLLLGNYIRPDFNITTKKTYKINRDKTPEKKEQAAFEIDENKQVLKCTLEFEDSPYISYEYEYTFKEDKHLDNFTMNVHYDYEFLEKTKSDIEKEIKVLVDDYSKRNYSSTYTDRNGEIVFTVSLNVEDISDDDKEFSNIKNASSLAVQANMLKNGAYCE